jgi:hypothetical protein
VFDTAALHAKLRVKKTTDRTVPALTLGLPTRVLKHAGIILEQVSIFAPTAISIFLATKPKRPCRLRLLPQPNENHLG